MPTNRKESLVFTMFMCAFMVFWMSVYNVSLHFGFSSEAIKEAWLGFPLAYLFAILCDWVIISKFAKSLAFKVVNPKSKPLIKIIMISFFMVCGMVILMSLYGAVEQAGISEQTLMVWLTNIPKILLQLTTTTVNCRTFLFEAFSNCYQGTNRIDCPVILDKLSADNYQC